MSRKCFSAHQRFGATPVRGDALDVQPGCASSVNHIVFGLGNVPGIALGGLMMTTAFEYHTGLVGVSPTTENSAVFVAALDTTLLVTAAATVVAIFTSGMRGGENTR